MYNESYLAHFGIKGMKWGVRRYTDKDGNLSAAGKARYNKDGKKKKPLEMTNLQLKKSTERLNAENRYIAALKESNNNKTSHKIGRSIAQAGATFVAYFGTTKLMNAISNGEFFNNTTRNLEIATLLSIASGLNTWNIKSGSANSMVMPDERSEELKNKYALELDKLRTKPQFNHP